MKWIQVINTLFDQIFGPDFMEYEYVANGKLCAIAESTKPRFSYCHQDWEEDFNLDKIEKPEVEQVTTEDNVDKGQPPTLDEEVPSSMNDHL